jgi:16S rRNA (adenine1518-N6/adenine1519-N6)-dimethyltransferase
VVKCAFAMRRKTLSNCLKRADLHAPDGFETVLRCCGIDGQRRGETLSPEEFACLSRCLSGETQ